MPHGKHGIYPVGLYVERADKTSRLLDVKHFFYSVVEDVGTPLETQWPGFDGERVLSVSNAGAFRQKGLFNFWCWTLSFRGPFDFV